jgi:DNA-binding transcriptional LysR family regulator
MGLGHAIVPSISWRDSFSENVRLYSIGKYERKTYLFTKPEELLTRAERLFIEILKEWCLEATSAI